MITLSPVATACGSDTRDRGRKNSLATHNLVLRLGRLDGENLLDYEEAAHAHVSIAAVAITTFIFLSREKSAHDSRFDVLTRCEEFVVTFEYRVIDKRQL